MLNGVWHSQNTLLRSHFLTQNTTVPIIWHALFAIAFRVNSAFFQICLRVAYLQSTGKKIILGNSQDSSQGWQITRTYWRALHLSVTHIVSESNFKEVPNIFWAITFFECLCLPQATLKGIYLDANKLASILLKNCNFFPIHIFKSRYNWGQEHIVWGWDDHWH